MYSAYTNDTFVKTRYLSAGRQLNLNYSTFDAELPSRLHLSPLKRHYYRLTSTLTNSLTSGDASLQTLPTSPPTTPPSTAPSAPTATSSGVQVLSSDACVATSTPIPLSLYREANHLPCSPVLPRHGCADAGVGAGACNRCLDDDLDIGASAVPRNAARRRSSGFNKRRLSLPTSRSLDNLEDCLSDDPFFDGLHYL